MSSVCLLAVGLMAQGQAPGWQLAVPLSRVPRNLPTATDSRISQLCNVSKLVGDRALVATAEFSRLEVNRQGVIPDRPATRNAIDPAAKTNRLPEPLTGEQLYVQRLAALQTGKIYTRLPANSFQQEWRDATATPTYEQWVNLLAQEANAMAVGQGSSELTVLLGDSISLWFPSELMMDDRFWLNQGISGDTTSGILRRISALDETRPDTIHVMAGINDLRRGATDIEIVGNLREIMRRLKQAHPQAQIIIHSILPTRLAALPTDRIRRLNYNISTVAEEEGVNFLNLQPAFLDDSGILSRDLTTDGIHLSDRGYRAWHKVMASIL
ncbi:MAG: hypothetical protein HC769_10265 [Cyanobacteria bacterium CRU_2_1]|nr:hypothetical protein [Cyanobacteria bacterium CRU_2_1]